MRTLSEAEVEVVSGGALEPIGGGNVYIGDTLDMNDLYPIPGTYEPIPVD